MQLHTAVCPSGRYTYNRRFITMNPAKLLKEIYTIARETSLMGAMRYIRYKLLCKKNISYHSTTQPNKGLTIIGAGTYTASIHLPVLRILNQPITAIGSASGKTATALAKIYKIPLALETTDDASLLQCANSLLFTTPHNLHPENIVFSLKHNLYSYCEKPVAINQQGIEKIQETLKDHPNQNRVMIGFNRRFSPAIRQLIREPWLTTRTQPLEIHYRVNFGPRVDNAMSNPEIGGGRIHGAACHYIDLISYISNANITNVSCISPTIGQTVDPNTFTAILSLSDGSIASLTFSSEGSRHTDDKEMIKISSSGHNVTIQNFNTLIIDRKRFRYYKHNYGALNCMRAFLNAEKRKQPCPITLIDGIKATRVSIALEKSLQNNGAQVTVNSYE